MSEIKLPVVLNTHHFGGIDKLPSTAVYIGRPGPYGNAYSSKSDQYTKEECVALHRVYLYNTLTRDVQRLTAIRQDLEGKDLACWCKQPKRIMGCHGDNYLHILSDRLVGRTYDQSVTFYLMDDLRFIIAFFKKWITTESCGQDYLFLHIHFEDLKVYLNEALRICRVHEVDRESLHFILAKTIIQLELAAQERLVQMVEYRFALIIWDLDCFLKKGHNVSTKPIDPSVPIKKPKKVKDHG